MQKKLKQMLPVIGVMGLTVFVSLLLYAKVLTRERERCWQLLGESAEAVSREIAMKFEDEMVKLRLAAQIMVEEEMLDESQLRLLHLEKFKTTTIFSRIDVLYPDYTVLMENELRKELPIDIDYQEIVAQGEHISERRTDFATGRECVYYCIPLIVKNETAAILIGVIDTNSLSELFVPTIYQGQANCCIIDSSDGNFIMDNWHTELGNAYEMDNRKRLSGYEDIDLKEENRNQRTGVIVFESQTTGLPLYMYYMPLKIFDWQFLMFVQEKVAFADVFYLRKLLMIAGVIEAFLLALYFCWNYRKISQLEKSKEETEWQLENCNILVQCVTELSSDKEIAVSIHNLLEIITGHFRADRTYIFELDIAQDTFVNTFESVREGLEPQINHVQETLISNLKTWTENYKKLPDKELHGNIKMDKEGVARCRLFPLCKNNMILGFFGIDNAEKHRDEMSILYSIQYFLTNAMLRQKQQEQLKYMSYRDMLTSLYNRNKYIQMQEAYSGRQLKKTGVVYIDLNGLKQINDTQSHTVGDMYIRTAAEIVSQCFPEQAYRIGGDEFVVVAQLIEPADFWNKLKQLKAVAEQKEVSVSIGSLWQDNCENLESMIKEAEQQMYQEKKEYHRTHDRYVSKG